MAQLGATKLIRSNLADFYKKMLLKRFWNGPTINQLSNVQQIIYGWPWSFTVWTKVEPMPHSLSTRKHAKKHFWVTSTKNATNLAAPVQYWTALVLLIALWWIKSTSKSFDFTKFRNMEERMCSRTPVGGRRWSLRLHTYISQTYIIVNPESRLSIQQPNKKNIFILFEVIKNFAEPFFEGKQKIWTKQTMQKLLLVITIETKPILFQNGSSGIWIQLLPKVPRTEVKKWSSYRSNIDLTYNMLHIL